MCNDSVNVRIVDKTGKVLVELWLLDLQFDFKILDTGKIEYEPITIMNNEYVIQEMKNSTYSHWDELVVTVSLSQGGE